MKYADTPFWNWIDHAASSDRGGLRTPNIILLDAAFCNLSDKKKEEIATSFRRELSRINRLDIWQLCSLLAGQPCGDDSFNYFRRWLILQGETIFKVIIANPDDMAIFLEKGRASLLEPFIESIGMVEAISISSDNAVQLSTFTPWSWRDSSKERIRNDLPRTWNLLGDDFAWMEFSELEKTKSESVCEVPELGTLRIGDRLFHKAGLGLGIITAILIPETAVVELEFSFGRKSIRISPSFFQRAP